ncbi:MAG: secondary thiamine-phosphate synthase enzyme YjbQ [Candidatus Aminicenantes bacterium]|jgi:secondary thiamine-phosphate synthase enzyme|nr:secondary thiamine-phosphate synthase enzyme YjbQ [Candidatus Aminicenantes bacterium]
MKVIAVKTHAREEFLDITRDVRSAVRNSGIENGIALVFVPHTTAGVTINENADPDVKEDILMGLKKMVPDSLAWRHAEGNSPAHVKAGLVGSSIHIIVEGGDLQLGTWQGIYFCEFDGPRDRNVFVKVFGQ